MCQYGIYKSYLCFFNTFIHKVLSKIILDCQNNHRTNSNSCYNLDKYPTYLNVVVFAKTKSTAILINKFQNPITKRQLSKRQFLDSCLFHLLETYKVIKKVILSLNFIIVIAVKQF